MTVYYDKGIGVWVDVHDGKNVTLSKDEEYVCVGTHGATMIRESVHSRLDEINRRLYEIERKDNETP